MNPVTILWFIDPDTGAYHGTCPSTEGRLLDTWGAQLDAFRTRWEAPSRLDQRARLAAAVETLRKGPAIGLGLPEFALGGLQSDGTRQAYRPVARKGNAMVLLRRVGVARPVDSTDTWRVEAVSVSTGEFWWVTEDDVLWPRKSQLT